MNNENKMKSYATGTSSLRRTLYFVHYAQRGGEKAISTE